MTSKQTIVISVVALLTAFAAGRFSTPVKTITKVQTVEVEKKNEKTEAQQKTNLHKTTTITETKTRDGDLQRVTKIDESSGSVVDNRTTDTVSESTRSDSSKETVRGSSLVTISALAGAKLSFSDTQLIYGASVTKPILGPVTIGVWGLSNSTGGLSVGLTF